MGKKNKDQGKKKATEAVVSPEPAVDTETAGVWVLETNALSVPGASTTATATTPARSPATPSGALTLLRGIRLPDLCEV